MVQMNTVRLNRAEVEAYLRSRRFKRGATMAAFYTVLFLLVATLLGTYVNPGQVQLSAYDDDWDDMSAFRDDLRSMGLETRSLVSSPLLLNEIENPENTVFIIAGVEKDTISLPRFTGDASIIQFTESDGYTSSEVEAVATFVAKGGTIIVMDDFGYSGGVAKAFGIEYSGHKLYDAGAWSETLDYNYIWINMTDGYMYDPVHNRTQWPLHPCGSDMDQDGYIDRLDPDPANPAIPGLMAITPEDAGLCAHRITGDPNNPYDLSPSFNLLLNSPSAFDPDAAEDYEKNRYGLGMSSTDSYLDINDDGDLTVGPAGSGFEGDLQGPFAVYIKYCLSSQCDDSRTGRAHFVADGSLLMNTVYDHGQMYGDQQTEIPDNDNRMWVLDAIAEALLTGNDSLMPGENAQVIFDESRHQQSSMAGEAYNLMYYVLVYFTSDWMAMLILFLSLFVAFEAVIIRKTDPEPWRHVFSIIYYGFGDARRYGYYSRANKIKQVLLSRVRNLNTLTREEFDALPARELQGMINDPVLVKFVFEDRNYSLEQLVAVVKRIKMWGRK